MEICQYLKIGYSNIILPKGRSLPIALRPELNNILGHSQTYKVTSCGTTCYNNVEGASQKREFYTERNVKIFYRRDIFVPCSAGK